MTIEELYIERCQKPEKNADIWEHLPTLSRYAAQCRHVTEFGVRTGNSTTAFLHGLSAIGGTLHSYDINQPTEFAPPEIPGVSWVFRQMNTADEGFHIWPTDLLFIDSCHTYEHVMKEFLQAPKAKKWIIMHDTAEAWKQYGGDGVWRARHDFLSGNREWAIKEHFDNCNGLTIMERRQ